MSSFSILYHSSGHREAGGSKNKIMAELTSLGPFRPYNSIRSVSYLKLNETNETL